MRALICGISGRDGAYLAQPLLGQRLNRGGHVPRCANIELRGSACGAGLNDLTIYDRGHDDLAAAILHTVA
jgi:GDP-D-mannose dehydratase